MRQAVDQIPSLDHELRRVRRWVDTSFVTLAETACDRRHGGFVERFDWSGAPIDPGFKRVRVSGRQTYVFVHAAIGDMPGTREAAARGAEFLKGKCLRPDRQFASRLTTSGEIVDGTADLYDIAFGLFALAWWHRLSADAQAVEIADHSLDHLLGAMRSPSGRGFLAREDDVGPHQQNPHMHLFEAVIFLSAFTPSRKAPELAAELFELVITSLYQSATGTLPEFFDANWQPDARCGPIRVEPGHHYEWVWLLSRYGALTGDHDALSIADRLFAFAQEHGHDPATGLVVDAVDPLGNMLANDLRLWPNTEYLKAQVAMRERHGQGPGFDDEAVAANLGRIFRYFLTPQARGSASALAPGLWIDYLKAPTLLPKCDHVPASALYHIIFGFSEVMRHTAGHAPFSGKPW